MLIFLFCKYMGMIAKNMTESWCLLLADSLQNYKGLGTGLADSVGWAFAVQA